MSDATIFNSAFSPKEEGILRYLRAGRLPFYSGDFGLFQAVNHVLGLQPGSSSLSSIPPSDIMAPPQLLWRLFNLVVPAAILAILGLLVRSIPYLPLFYLDVGLTRS